MSETKKGNAFRDRMNLLWFGILFALFYWILEAVRDVLVFEKGNIVERIFFPDMMSFWMRLLVVCILLLFGVYAHSLKQKIESRHIEMHPLFGMVGIVKAGFMIGVLYWILESVRDVFIFGKGNLFERILIPDPMSLWMRLLAVLIIILFAIYAQSLINERKKAEEALRKEQEKLERMVVERTAELTESNRLLRLLKKEISQRTRMEDELRRANRALKTTGECNMVLVRATDERDLLKDVCDIIVEVGGYRLAWVGYAKEDEHRSVCVMSHAGWDDGYLSKVKFVWNDAEGDRNPVGRAIRNKKTCIVKIGQSESKHPIWRSEASQREYASVISIPLIRNDVAFGALSIYSKDIDAFDESEVRLLVELTDDLAFGIMVLRTRLAHRRAEKEKEKIQTQLLQARKMEAIGILAGGIAHDFNNLMTVILGCADMINMEIDPSHTISKDLKEIQVSAQRAAELTRQLLLFSRKQPMRFSTLDINQSIENLLQMLRRFTGDHIEVKTDLEQDLWTIRADRNTLQQVIMNLVLNARDAMPDGGRITIATKNCVLNKKQCENSSEAQPGEWACISVTDTGIGIDRKIIRHIFEPFFSTKDVGKGTGLGLSVVYGIVKQHEGWMDVSSQSGRGSTFRIYFPAFRMEPKKIEKPSDVEKKSTDRDARVLVVDDEANVREFTTSGLLRNGYKVFSAANAQQARQIFRKEKGDFNVVLCDMALPDKDGMELVDEFLAVKPSLGVLMSRAPHLQVIPVQRRGFRFLEKPYSINDLVKHIYDVLPA